MKCFFIQKVSKVETIKMILFQPMKGGESSSCIYKEYTDYCAQQGYKARSQSALTEYLESKGIIHKKKQFKGDRVWRYIHLAIDDKKGVNF